MLSPKKRFEVLKRDNFRCQYCGRNWKDVTLEVDHIIPESKWGTDEMSNLVACCRECNMGKWNEEINSRDSTYKIKINDFEWKIIKQFFKHWNDTIHATLDQRNVSFVANFMKRAVDYEIKRELKWMISDAYPEESMDFREEKVIEFYQWDDEVFKKVEPIMERYVSSVRVKRPIEECKDDETRNTDDYNKRLNRVLTWHLKAVDKTPYRIIKKYSLYPYIEIIWE